MTIPGKAALRAVVLPAGTRSDLTLPGEPTDIDVTPDGKLAVVVLRDQKLLALVDLPGDLADPQQVETRQIGLALGQAALTDDGKQALLFTNASEIEAVVLVQLAGGGAGDSGSSGVTSLPLKKAVRSVRLAPGGKTALVIHNKKPGEPSEQDPFELFIDRSHGFSLIELSKRFVKLQLTDATPGPAAFAADGGSVYVLAGDRDKRIRQVVSIDLSSFVADEIVLGSHPLSVGVVPLAGQIYVAQSHPLGRVTFIDAKTRETRTLTGFALNSEVIE